MALAYRRVVGNKGAAGVDGMKVDQLEGYLKIHWSGIGEKLETGDVSSATGSQGRIPKPGGGKRMLGIPTAIDRLVAQALLQVFTPLWEPTLSEHSYGFRPGRNVASFWITRRQ
jgi:RNA-directed DNA polymerase